MSTRSGAALAIRQHGGIIAVAFAVLLGVSMRVAGWTWGLPTGLHADEWVIVEGALDLVHRKSFEPASYSRPDHVEIQLSYLAYVLYSQVFLNMPVEGAYAEHPGHFLLISRAITTLFGVAMIVLAYLIGKRIHRQVGLIAAVLFALFPPFVENSQYATPDVPVTAALMLVVLACMHYLAAPGYRSLLLASAASAVAIAIKYPGALGTVTIALVVVWAGIRDRAFWRIPRDGAIAIVAVVGFLFLITPVLFTNVREVIDAFSDQSANDHDGVQILGWAGNARFYADTYLHQAGVIVTALTLVGVAVAVRKRLPQAIPLAFSFVYWLALSAIALHWPRWGLPMFATPLMLAAVGTYYGYTWLKERGTLGRWLVPVASVLAALALGNMLANAAPVATRPIVDDTRLSMQPELARLGVTTKNAIYEGYSPLLPNAPKRIFEELEVDGGRPVPLDSTKQYVVESSCMRQRYDADPTYRALYDALADHAPVVTELRTDVRSWDRTWFEPLNLLRAPESLWDHVSGGTTGCDITVRRLQTS